MPLEGDKTRGPETSGNTNPGQFTGQVSGQTVSRDTINVDFFDPKQQTFRRWLQRLEGAFRVFKIQGEQEKVAYLLHFLGVEAFGILCDRLDPQDPYLLPYDNLLNKLKEYYAPEPLEIAEIFVFRKRLQLLEENAQEYMAALQKLSLYCKFGEYLKTELRNQFVYGLRNQRIQGRLLETANLTMESALKTASGMELAEKGVTELKAEAAVAVDFVGSSGKAKKKMTDKEIKSKGHQKNYKSGKRTNACGQNHLAPDCTLPRHVKCHECGGFGHLQKVCKKKGKAQLLEEVFRLDELEHSHFRDKYMVSLYLENRRVTFEVDCGAAVTLKYSDIVSEEFPSMSKVEARLKLKENAKPVFLKSRAVPFKLKEKVEAELESMVQSGILEKVESSRWATPIVPMRAVGPAVIDNSQIQAWDCVGPIINQNQDGNEFREPLPALSERERSLTVSSELSEQREVQEGTSDVEEEAPDQAVHPEVPPASVSSRERPERKRKPPDRFGDYFSY
ncbi:uncharacterized protein LOC114935532 [Nylanderia fulva]|uniref:uncharacterized protein LOC114935532 n=1 Tax=Nylanderia fulva TaxID=613905 RepID=UPI0010FB000A|nr:uncharacterized protein LOC114935532 [Nylanderia fulva]